jgi:predicted nicotinamide N-methyase
VNAREPWSSAKLIEDPAGFVRANTEPQRPPLVPEIELHLASEIVPLWQASEEEMAATGLPPPFWAFAWAGGQALARYLLDHPEVAAGKRVLDFACGSGLQGIAAALAGARAVAAADIDPFARAAAGFNASINGAEITIMEKDLLGQAGGGWDLVLAGDVCYEAPAAARIEAWLRRLADGGATVLLGDPGRTYLPKSGLERIISYGVKTSRELEDTDLRNAVVWRVLPT